MASVWMGVWLEALIKCFIYTRLFGLQNEMWKVVRKQENQTNHLSKSFINKMALKQSTGEKLVVTEDLFPVRHCFYAAQGRYFNYIRWWLNRRADPLLSHFQIKDMPNPLSRVGPRQENKKLGHKMINTFHVRPLSLRQLSGSPDQL